MNLEEFAAFPNAWTHVEKLVTPGPDLALPGAYLKWYDIHVASAEVPTATRDQARAYLLAETSAGRLVFQDELGFVMLHRDGSQYFMLVSVWRNKNELWQWLSQSDSTGVFQGYPRREGLLQPTRDIYELDCTAHERRAWSRYLSSSRDGAAKQTYVEDRCVGVLG